jgi:hypothetical protein
VNVLIVYARDVGAWWIIPADHVPRAKAIHLGRRFDEWQTAWDVFDRV